MQVPSREALLSKLDSMGYGARIAWAATLGRDSRGNPALTQLMAELLSGDAYEACLALELAQGARDEAPLLRGLTHPSSLVRGRAAAFAGSFIQDDAALERALPELAPFVRRRLLKGVALARRSALAARLLPLVLSRHGDAEAALLLPALEVETVRRLLPELEHALRSWDTLVHRYPDEVLAYIRSCLADAPERERATRFSFYRAPLTELTLRQGEAVLVLVRDFCPPDTLPLFVTETLPRLTRRHPEQVFALLTRPAFRARLLSQGLSNGLLRQAKAFSQSQRLALARTLAEAPQHLALFLEALPPSERPALFAHAFEGTTPRVLPEALLAVLPYELRDTVAARQLGLREVQENRDLQLAMHALRTIEHAREPLQKAAFASKAEDRARALALLVSSTGLSRRGLTETLAYLSRLKNEQDPVRLAALTELAQVPPSIVAPEHIPALETLVTYVVEARDTSRGTQMALQELAFRLIRAHATAPEGPLFRFALDTLKRLAGQSGTLVLPSLERDLPRGAEHHLFAALLPMIRSASQRESYGLILTLTQALGRRAWNVDMLQAMLEPITEATPDWLAQTAIQLWLAPPRTRDVRVRKLLDRDESIGTFPFVFEHLHRRRQEWLDPYLQGRRLKGRFTSGKTGWVPQVRSGFHRWLPRQQRRFLDLLLRIARDTERSAWERMSVVSILPRMQVVAVDTLTPFLGSKDVPIVEAALGAFAWLDQPEPALPLLLEHLDGDRARVAMYAVPRVAKLVSPDTLSTALGALLSREKLKVTVHKEALRLLGTFRSARSVALLRQQWDKPQLHRDVRIAVGHAARQLLDDPAAWELLEAMAQSPDAYVAASLLDQHPGMLPPEARPRYAALVLQVSRHPELTVRRQAFTALPGWSAGVEELVAREAAGRVLDFSGGAEWREASKALVEATREGKSFGQVVVCLETLVSSPVPESQDARPERDNPARQRLKTLCQELLSLPRPVRIALRTHLDEAARVLARDVSLWPESAALRLSCLEWRDAGSAMAGVLELAAEVREEPLFAPALATAVADSVGDPLAEWTPEALLETADGVASEAPLASVALVSAAGQRLHWRADAARWLRVLRQHPSAAVRAAAFATVTANE
ncbi:hypothetical protein [Vitiosangium sp. GDMCC 1.1324]|uniref:hypothetical protein n=1 Tax=Vitiosangium sp. (strain GDMCC 1.1324) TaxID=2138576 RepID=UPI000D3D36B3|nr:hypothetical protein [Vitiosangium sp. GDMCC 1.1324]PTL79009.1 hypothetical protein DAT35_35915 [Vitiosangium sp. GDMCC 1.1324]